MKKIITILTLFLFHTALASAQCVSGPAPSPRTVVEQLWMMATQGDLLTSEGWDKATKSLFLDPKPTPGNKVILIISNDGDYRVKRSTGTKPRSIWAMKMLDR